MPKLMTARFARASAPSSRGSAYSMIASSPCSWRCSRSHRRVQVTSLSTGDDRALPYLSRAFDAYTLRDSDSPFANQDLIELQAAIEELGGTLTSRQLAKF